MQIGKYYSWEIINESIAIKTVDFSLFKYYRSGIPKEIRCFWDINDMTRGEKRHIKLVYNGKSYDSYIKMDDNEYMRTTMFLHSNLIFDLGLNYFAYKINKTKKLPILQFEKLHKNIYNINYELQEGFNNKPIYKNAFMISSNYKDGKRINVYTSRYERNPRNREEALKIHGAKCTVCGFDFEKTYGELGRQYIEVHHIKSLYSIGKETEINPYTDLATLCSNCHRMIHRKKDKVLSIEELRKIVKKNM